MSWAEALASCGQSEASAVLDTLLSRCRSSWSVAAAEALAAAADNLDMANFCCVVRKGGLTRCGGGGTPGFKAPVHRCARISVNITFNCNTTWRI